MVTDHNPADIDDILAHVRPSTEMDAKEAVTAAQEAFPDWAATPAPQRGQMLFRIAEIMEQRKDEWTRAIVREMGKTYAEAQKEVLYAANITRFYAGEGRRLTGTLIPADLENIQIETKKEPLGVVLAVTPWNFPLSIPVWKTMPAILSGNTVVLKSSSETPYVATQFMKMLEEAGLPAGVVNHVVGPGRLVNTMLEEEAVKAVSFTGSNRVGNLIYQKAAEGMKRVQLEMGGKNPLLVLEDADIDEAVQIAAQGGFSQAGQACTATGRVIVHSAVAEAFTEKLADMAKRMRVGNGADDDVDMGPQVNESEQSSTLAYIREAVEEGATVVAGGDDPINGNGYFVRPTVLRDVHPGMTVAQEEVFGPVLSIIEVQHTDEAIEVANETAYGLSASVCTQNLREARRCLDELQAGLVKINMPTTGTFFQAPFGGYKASSSGTFKELGREAIEFYCKTKTRYVKS